jgi:hypothetical protein
MMTISVAVIIVDGDTLMMIDNDRRLIDGRMMSEAVRSTTHCYCCCSIE